MPATNDIVTNAVNSADHTTLVSAKLPAGTVDTLLTPDSRDALVKVLTAHVVPSTWTAEAIRKAADADGMVNLPDRLGRRTDRADQAVGPRVRVR